MPNTVSTRGLPIQAYHPDAVVQDLLTIMDRLGIAAADVLGFSFGGLLAQRLAVTAPQRIRRLILASSSVLPVPVDAYAGWPERNERVALEQAVWQNPALRGPARTRAAAAACARANVWRRRALPEY
ncbi:alpha/beta fold hydrolase [Nocardia sp. CWNU-33]|uniref:alpha/beta fold hydrolase n=1 Tax=Nocardia sp. CWNU-33 TaxID=3392117 RepID=UPI00398EC2C6